MIRTLCIINALLGINIYDKARGNVSQVDLLCKMACLQLLVAN